LTLAKYGCGGISAAPAARAGKRRMLVMAPPVHYEDLAPRAADVGLLTLLIFTERLSYEGNSVNAGEHE
jgi:hypothetical protein